MNKIREIKPISFNLNNDYDIKLLKHIEDSGVKFGTYIKNLIQQDMQKNNENNNNIQVEQIVNAIDKLTKVIENKSVSIVEKKELNIDNEEKEIIEDQDSESNSIIKGLLNFNKN